jgi:hypothetical protein
MAPPITYGQLYDKLAELGFSRRRIEMYGKPRYVFEHKTIPNAMIVLPERSEDDPVESFHVASVLATLKAHRLVLEGNLLAT